MLVLLGMDIVSLHPVSAFLTGNLGTAQGFLGQDRGAPSTSRELFPLFLRARSHSHYRLQTRLDDSSNNRHGSSTFISKFHPSIVL